ncbi:MAG: endo alpha-1,4 polygalactosaminidase [Methylococcales bacterium]|nr:endo alpha-1,4 polygalactosaminidase [Methylococcales bacterium]
MLIKLLVLAIYLILIACGRTPSSSSENEELAVINKIPSTVINNIKITTWMYQIQDLYDKNIDILAKTNYDMLVVEPGFNFKESPYDTPKIVSSLSTKPNGKKRLLLAYIDIGQAEEYRDYWQEDWIAPTKETQGIPGFLISTDPDGWSGNYPVAFWDTRWKSIWLDKGIISKLATQGFDGIYLDWVEAYDDKQVLEFAQTQNIDTEKEMLDFIKELKKEGQRINPSFVVISQNAQYLLDYAPNEYASIIDGISTEDTWFYGKGDVNWDDANAGDLSGDERHDDDYSTKKRIVQNLKYLDLQLPVFTVDYCVLPKNAYSTYATSRKNGFIPIVTRVSLSQLTETPPPEFKIVEEK